MNFLKKIFGKKDKPIQSYADFWKWFQQHEKSFFKVVQQHEDVEEGFFNKLSPKLAELKDGYFFLTGMYKDDMAELVLTADGAIRNIVFVEELVQAAPPIAGWKFTALKPALTIDNVNIQMAGHQFNKDNISFYANELADYPDEIDITIVHHDLTEANKEQMVVGVYIFLDNYLGELDFATSIDNLTIIGKQEAQKELVPIVKLKDFLIWREKEFVEKYDGLRYNTDDDRYGILEAQLKNGNALIAVVNTDLLNWDSKASHPWVLVVTIKYDGEQNRGMPDKETMELLNEIEDEMIVELKDIDGYLNIGRQTANGEREIYFACKDFRKPSKLIYETQKKQANKVEMTYDIYKDKYWQSFERFNRN